MSVEVLSVESSSERENGWYPSSTQHSPCCERLGQTLQFDGESSPDGFDGPRHSSHILGSRRSFAQVGCPPDDPDHSLERNAGHEYAAKDEFECGFDEYSSIRLREKDNTMGPRCEPLPAPSRPFVGR